MSSLQSLADTSQTSILLLIDYSEQTLIESSKNFYICLEKIKDSETYDLSSFSYVILLLKQNKTIKLRWFLKFFNSVSNQCSNHKIPIFLLMREFLNPSEKKVLKKINEISARLNLKLRIRLYSASRNNFSLGNTLNQFFPQISWKDILIPPPPAPSKFTKVKWSIFPSIVISIPGLLIYWAFMLNATGLLLSYCQLQFLFHHHLPAVSACNLASQNVQSLYSYIPGPLASFPTSDKVLNFNRTIGSININLLQRLTLTDNVNYDQSLFTTTKINYSGSPLLAYQNNLYSNLQRTQPDIVNFLSNTPLTFLLVVLDSNEVKPAGGTPLSFVVVRLEKNKPLEYKILEPSYIESQSHGDQPAPPILSRVVNSDVYSVYDAFWDPDLSASAEIISRFLKEDLNGGPDVLVLADQSLITELLRVSGQTSAPNTSVAINYKNFNDNLFAAYSSGRSFSEKFISSLLDRLLPRLNTLSDNQQKALIQRFYDLADSRRVSLVFPRKPILSVESLGWTNKVLPSFCRSSLPCQSDYFYVSEFTLPGLKTDRYVSRVFDLQSMVDSRQINSDYLLTYENKSPDNFPYGTDKKYVRLFLSPGSKLDNLLINNVIQPPNEYSLENIRGMPVVGFYVSTPVSQKTSIRLIFHRNVSNPQFFHFQLDFPVLPGTSPQVSYTLSFPPLWQAVIGGSPAVASPSLIRYNTPVNKALNVNINFHQTDL